MIMVEIADKLYSSSVRCLKDIWSIYACLVRSSYAIFVVIFIESLIMPYHVLLFFFAGARLLCSLSVAHTNTQTGLMVSAFCHCSVRLDM